MKLKQDTYTRARIEILHYLLQFSTAKYFGDKKEGHEYVFQNIEMAFRGGFSDAKPEIGSLCVLTSAATTKHYLSWLLDYKEEGYGGSWLMQSVEDYSLCWWTNVSIYFLPKRLTDQFVMWKWTDGQFEFYDQWKKAAKRVDDHWTRILLPVFHNDGSVTLGTREHIFMTAIDKVEGYLPTKTFSDWRKVKLKDMVEFFRYAVSSNPRNKTTPPSP